jgi:hypothetical protein
MGDQSQATGVGRSWKSYFSAETKEACEAKMTTLGYSWEWLEDGTLKATTPRLEAVANAPGTETPCFFNQLPATLFNAKEFMSVVGEAAAPTAPATGAAVAAAAAASAVAAAAAAGGTATGDVEGNAESTAAAAAEGDASVQPEVPFSFDRLAPVNVTQEALNMCLSFGDGSPISVAVLEKVRALCEANAVDLQWQSGDVALLDNFMVMHARRYWTGSAGTRKLLASLVH